MKIMDSVSWSDLPEDIFLTIAGRLHTVIDYLNVSRVCKPWRSTALSPLNLSIPSKPPFLMLPAESKGGEYVKSTPECLKEFVEFNDQGNPKVFTLSLPEIHDDVRIMGSTGNWLILIDLKLDIFIFNPFTKTKLQFPSQYTHPHQLNHYGSNGKLIRECDCENDCNCAYTQEEMRNYFIKKAFLSFSNLNDVVMMIICGREQGLAIARPGDLSWTPAETYHYRYKYFVHDLQDVIFFKGQFYFVNARGKLAACDSSSTPLKGVKIMKAPQIFENVGEESNFYLVVWLGKLLLVARYLTIYEDRMCLMKLLDGQFKEKPFYETSRFEVYMLNFNTKKWEEVTSLGEHSLFLGFNTSVSLLVSEYSPFKRNCVYFTDNDREGGHDVGMFDLSDKTIKTRYNGVLPHYDGPSDSFLSPPLWIVICSTIYLLIWII